LDIKGTFSIPKNDAISSAYLGFVVPLTNLNLLLVRLKFDSFFCTAVMKLVTKLALLIYILIVVVYVNFAKDNN